MPEAPPIPLELLVASSRADEKRPAESRGGGSFPRLE